MKGGTYMCKYCDNTEDIKNEIGTLRFADGTIIDKSRLCVSIATSIKDNKNKLFIDAITDNDSMMFTLDINYCPMCGRNLKGVE